MDTQQPIITEINKKIQEAKDFVNKFQRQNATSPYWTDLMQEQLAQELKNMEDKAELLKKLKEELFVLSAKLTEAESALLASKVKQTAKGLWTSLTSMFGGTSEQQPEIMAKTRFFTRQAESMLEKINRDYYLLHLTNESPQLAAYAKRLRELQTQLPPTQAASPAALSVAQPINPPRPVAAAPVALPIAQPVERKQ